MTFNLGDLIRATATFHDLTSGELIDPDVVQFLVRNPAGTVTTYEYDDDPEVIRSSTGVYYMDISGSSAGDWYVRPKSTGEGQAATEKAFSVRSALAVPA